MTTTQPDLLPYWETGEGPFIVRIGGERYWSLFYKGKCFRTSYHQSTLVKYADIIVEITTGLSREEIWNTYGAYGEPE